MSAEREGRCLCGDLAYAVAGEPATVTVCHCRFCQRATGGAYLVDALFKRDRFRVTKGTPARYDHLSEGSGNIVHIQFCARCGTKLWLEFQRFPQLVGIYAGTLDDPNGIDRSPARTHYIFTDQAADWTVLPAGARLYPGDTTGPGRERVTPLCLTEARITGA
ncbi:GFA family protein [Cereibacter sphaeroides]|nr:GFA family protein [Cereibacter sphaeroides]